MCLPPISRGAPGKYPPSSSSSTSSASTGPTKRRRRGDDEVATRVAAATSSGSTGKHPRSSAPVRRGKDGGVGGGPSRKTSTRGRERSERDRERDTSRLAPPRARGAMESPLPSPAFSERRSSSKRHHHSSAPAPTPTRRKRTESQNSTPRTPVTATFQKERKSRKKPADMIQKEQIITMQAPLRGGGTISGVVVIRPGSSSESGTSKSSSRERSSESSNTSKATTLVASGAGTVGLGITLESSRTPTPTSKGKVERLMGFEQVEHKVAQVTVPIPKIEVEQVKEVVNEPVKLMRVIPPPAPGPAPPASIPQSKAVPPPPASISQSKAAPPVETYPIMATLVYPTKESLAYQPISRYQVTSKITSTIPNLPAVRATPLVIDPANVRLPPSMLKYQNNSPASSVHELPLRSGGTPALSISQQSSLSSLVSGSTASSSASASSSIKEPLPNEPHIQYLNSTASSSTSSLVSASSAQSFQSARPSTPQQKVNYYRYAAVAPTPAHRPLKAIMDSPRLPRAGPWDGMPGADPNLGAYYRNAAVAGKPKPTQPAVQKEEQVDPKTLAAYYANAKQKTALERSKYERSDESETEASDESASEISAIPSQNSYYRTHTTTITAPEPDNTLALSPTKKEHTTTIAGHKVFISTLRRSAPQVFHTARPPPAPTPPPGGGATSAVGDEEDEEGPPEGSAENWFRGMKEQMGKDTGVKEGWAEEEDEVVVPAGIPPPAPTPPLAREEEEEIHLDNGYYGSPRMPYGYQR
ncbi:hypothetical protein DFP73DRAFT_275091 [Morchella snyderi]|nr:hypothetical protein DFP73DRAFT_275091 [Morchella snyderi]